MIKVGLTGGIGSGKTTVSEVFSSFGIPIYNSDQRAKELMNSDEALINSIKELLGNDAYNDGVINRPYIAEQVFQSKPLLIQLNQLVHPRVAKDFSQFCKQHKEAKLIIKEAAILIESGAYKALDKIIVVQAAKDKRIERVMQRDHISAEEVQMRMDNQLSDEERLKYADFVINNDGEYSLLLQVQKVIEELTKTSFFASSN